MKELAIDEKNKNYSQYWTKVNCIRIYWRFDSVWWITDPWTSIKEINPSIRFLEDIEKLQNYERKKGSLYSKDYFFRLKEILLKHLDKKSTILKVLKIPLAFFRRLLKEMWSPTTFWYFPKWRQPYQTAKGIRWEIIKAILNTTHNFNYLK